jgi:hypothetical protein
MWLGKKGFMVEKKFDTDFKSALAAYVTLKEANKRYVTLRSLNAGFSPPDRIARRMRQYNDKGIYWCPYCIQLREFREIPIEGIVECPVCEVTSRDFHVRKHNPKAELMIYRQVPRRTRGKRRRAA